MRNVGRVILGRDCSYLGRALLLTGSSACARRERELTTGAITRVTCTIRQSRSSLVQTNTLFCILYIKPHAVTVENAPAVDSDD